MAYLAYKFRLYPNANQERELRAQLETLRHVYNDALRFCRDMYEVEGAKPKRGGLYGVFAALRNLQREDQKNGGAGPHWLTRISSYAMRDVLVRLEEAYGHFFRRVREKKEKAGFPRFKSFGRLSSIKLFGYGQGADLRNRETGAVQIRDVPASRRGYFVRIFGVGDVRVNAHRTVAGALKTICIKLEPDGKWYVVLTAETPDVAIPPADGVPIGVDVGIAWFLTDSDGEHVENPRILKNGLKKLRRLQRAASRKCEAAKRRKVKFRECRNLQKSFRGVARFHVRVRNIRKEFHHKEANYLLRRVGVICVESLNIRGMVKNGKLARSIQDCGWAAFLNVLRHKAERAGVRFVEVDAQYTSQTCSRCGYCSPDNRTTQAKFYCGRCGYRGNADTNAARNILARGTSPPGPGGADRYILDVGRGGQRSPTVSESVSTTCTRVGVQKEPPNRAGKSNRSRAEPQSCIASEDR